MWRGYVEADSGEQLRIIRPDGSFGGKAILAFLNTFSTYLYHTADDEADIREEIKWFEKLAKKAKEPLKETLAPVENAYYAGDWGEYSIDEWEFFIRRNKIKITQWEFEQALTSMEEKWTLINKVLKSVTCFVKILETNEIQAAAWYHPDDTLPEFKGLQDTLQLLKERHARTVRIKFLM